MHACVAAHACALPSAPPPSRLALALALALAGGALAYSRSAEHRALLRGIEHADSLALGPQKWLFTPRLCALAPRA